MADPSSHLRVSDQDRDEAALQIREHYAFEGVEAELERRGRHAERQSRRAERRARWRR